MIYDTIIVGSGPAGLTSALYLRRANKSVLIIEREAPGGKMLKTSVIENYPGFKKTTGADLAYQMYSQVVELKTEFLFTEVLDINKENNFKVTTKKGIFESKTIIYAAGNQNRALKVPGEQKLIGKGISYCAICDGGLYKDQKVIVVGGGNSAFEESLYLSNICKNVTIAVRKEEAKAESILIEKIKVVDNIQVLYDTTVEEFVGNTNLEQVKLHNTKTDTFDLLDVKAAFIYIGFVPSTVPLQKFEVMNEFGFIIVDENLATKVPGLYAREIALKRV